jgi:hypothetical protein
MRYSDIRKPEDMIEYMIGCTLATVESMIGKKPTPKRGEFLRQCTIAQKGIDFLGRDYPYHDRHILACATCGSVFDYYTNKHNEIMKLNHK